MKQEGDAINTNELTKDIKHNSKPFLDIKTSRSNTDFETLVYRKVTLTDKHILFVILYWDIKYIPLKHLLTEQADRVTYEKINLHIEK